MAEQRHLGCGRAGGADKTHGICLGGGGPAQSVRFKPCVCKPVGFSDTDVNTVENKTGANLRPMDYWWLWLFDTTLVSAGLWFFLATQYGTYEFFGKACAMAFLPLIPALVLVGGAGSTIFALTKVMIEKRSLRQPEALALLVGPALVVTLLIALLGVFKSPGPRLASICLGNAPASASQVQVTGYSTFLRSEWLAVFQVDSNSFQEFVSRAKLKADSAAEFKRMLEGSAHKGTRLFQSLPPLTNSLCFKRVFKESEEHQRGGVYAIFDPATSTAAVFREYHD
jgi:hypothetical protein